MTISERAPKTGSSQSASSATSAPASSTVARTDVFAGPLKATAAAPSASTISARFSRRNVTRPTSIATGNSKLGAENLAGVAKNDTPNSTPAQNNSSPARSRGIV